MVSGGTGCQQVGRDHHGQCFTIWMAGGGIKPGIEYGRMDDFNYNILENRVHIRDMNATILHCLGSDHNRLTFKIPGQIPGSPTTADRRGAVLRGVADPVLNAVGQDMSSPAGWVAERPRKIHQKNPASLQ